MSLHTDVQYPTQIASAEAGGVRLALELLQPPATVRTAALELLQELLGGLLNAPVYQAFAMVRHMDCTRPSRDTASLLTACLPSVHMS